MNYIDLIIIYLACGSPFGVYQITKGGEAMSASHFGKIVSSFLFWPISLVQISLAQFSTPESDGENSLLKQVEHMRSQMEHIAFASAATAALFEFREVFYRYTGLLEAVNAEIQSTPAYELFEIEGTKNELLPLKCLARRNREKLAFHQTQARNEFVDLISALAAGIPEHRELVNLALELVDNLGDPEAVADLSALQIVKSRSQPNGNLKGKVWQAPARPISTVR